MMNVMGYRIGKEGFKRTQHPTEKPELLTRRLVEIFTNEGDIVLDSFAGGGTTGVFAIPSLVGWEAGVGAGMWGPREVSAVNRVWRGWLT